MRVRFHGAAGEVTGSCHEVHANGKMLLLDCGMIQGSDEDEKRNELEFPFAIDAIDAVVLSHAHIDHCGRLPLLINRGYRGPIYTQTATADLLKILLEDAASLAQMDAERDNKHRREGHQNHRPLFTKADVASVLKHVKVLAYDEPVDIFPDVKVTLRDAGHILGSASVTVESEGKTLLFSGDLGPLGTPILRDPAIHSKADLVLLESTYGGRLHRSREATVAELGDIFAQAWRDGGNVLIPAFCGEPEVLGCEAGPEQGARPRGEPCAAPRGLDGAPHLGMRADQETTGRDDGEAGAGDGEVRVEASVEGVMVACGWPD